MKPIKIPAQPVGKRLKNFREVELGFTKKTAIDEARKFPQSHDPSCQPKCPLGINILEFVRLLREGEVGEAYRKIRENSDLPGMCGRICLAPCEEEFIIGGEKMPIDVRALERYVADHGRPRFFGRKKLTCAKDRIAIIGSGPAGLSAAAILARELYCVTVFESLPKLGGVLRYGIPELRLSNAGLDAEISLIRDLGVDFQTNMTFGQNITFDGLMEQGFSAVLLAVGKSHPEFLDIPGTDAQGVFYAQELLLKLNFSEEVFEREFSTKLGEKVLILGDQSLALDCARACRRLGKDVSVVFQRTEEELDVHRNELEYAKEEGIVLQKMMKPIEVKVDDENHAAGLKCSKMDFADKNGEWVLMPVPESDTVLETDAVVIACGYDVNPLLKRTLPDLNCNDDGTIWIDGETGQTSIEKIFAAGDVVDPREHVLDSMVSGKWSAEQIIKFLSKNLKSES